MKSLSFFALLLLPFSALFAQQRELKNPLVDSKDILKKGVALHEEGKYKQAIQEFLKVPVSDTGYASILHELILSYYSDSNFVEAEKYGNIGLKLFPDKKNDWYDMLANVYDDTKRTDLALRAYDTILAQSPYSYLSLFNKGVTYFRMEKFDEAAGYFQQCLLINPYYASAHFFLGRLALLKGNLVQAMLSFSANLLVAPEGRYHNSSLSYLNIIAEVNNSVSEVLQKYKPGREDNFDDIQEIIVSKAALDKKYKLKTDLEDKIVRQLQVLLEKLEYNAGDKGFFMQYYVPVFKDLWDNKQFEPMVYYMFSGVDIKKITEYNKKEKKDIEKMSSRVVDYLNSIRETHELVQSKRAAANPRYYIKSYAVFGKGAYGKNTKGQDIVAGPWEFYHDNGRVQSAGSFDDNGERQGKWRLYYDNGIMKEETAYEKGKANGKSQSWHDNGLVYIKSQFVNDLSDGEETVYFYSGQLRSVVNYKAGKKEGLAKYYSVDGYLRRVTHYSNDLQEGDETTYYADGKVDAKVAFTKDQANGEYIEYYDNGKIYKKGFYTEGKKSGAWSTYYRTGKVQNTENYVKGELEGDYISYHKDGKTESKSFYRKGEIDGKKEDFDDDGIVFSESIFERGRLRDIKFFDKKGTVISNTTSRKGNADIAFYNADGIKTSDGYYSKEGLQEGKGTYYYKNGKVSMEANYKNGLLEGKRTQFYADGKMKQEGFYKANDANGYFVYYYNNGQVSEEGWYVNGERQGTFISYDLLGKLTSKIYYLNDHVHGISEFYYASGPIEHNEYHDNGWFYKTEQFDSTGKIMTSSTLDKGVGTVSYNHFNGKTYFESQYKNYKLNGKYTATNGDGSKRSISFYKNGALDSTYTWWFPNGKQQLSGIYKNGSKAGKWNYYTMNGTITETENYKDGSLDGLDIQFSEDGSVEKEMYFTSGNLDSIYRMYGENKELAIEMYYKNDDLTGYSYLDKTGKMVPVIPVPNGSGKVTAYYKNGNKSVQMDFNESYVNGERLLYSVNGKAHITGARINGSEHGVKKVFYSSGKIMKEENYYYGQRHGNAKYYNENGTLIYDVNYYLGDLHGDCKYYTAGKLTDTYFYYYGLLESKK